MLSITLKTYWQPNGIVSSVSYALKDSLEHAQAWVQSQKDHYNKQGFFVTWQVFEHHTCVDQGRSEPEPPIGGEEFIKHEYQCGICGIVTLASADDIAWMSEESPFMGCGDRWEFLDKEVEG